MQIGEDVALSFASPKELPRATEANAPAWRDEIHFPDATYIAPHFSHFELAAGDYVIVRSPDNSRSWRYEGLGKADLGTKGGFWGIHIPGDRAIVEFYSATRDGRYGYEIDRFARGFTGEELVARYGITLPDLTEGAAKGGDGDQESLCGTDDSGWARCYSGTIYSESRAVARLLINGSGLCTGWLVGSAGHLMTNEHCITSQSQANNVDVEFLAEGSSCSTNCASSLACPGTVVATSATLVQDDAPLDYALLQLPSNPTGTYGYMQLRASGAVNGERIYIPQHPAGWGKKIAVNSTHPQNPGGFAEVDSITAPRCGASGNDVEYYADTQGGSSGSPVLATSDNLVIALHHCRGDIACTSSGGDGNRGVPIQDVIADLGSNVPPNAVVGGGGGCSLPPGDINYCRDCGPCDDGEGDCDNNSECAAGTTCVNNVGANYGWPSWVDVCESTSSGCPWQPGDWNYCRDCGPCTTNQGDCDSDAECLGGRVCVDNIGAQFGWSASVDVCQFQITCGGPGQPDCPCLPGSPGCPCIPGTPGCPIICGGPGQPACP